MKHVGLEPVGPSMAAGELTSKWKGGPRCLQSTRLRAGHPATNALMLTHAVPFLLGVVEKTLSVLFKRGHLVPWLTVSLFIDEIDGIAPNRTSSSSESKVRAPAGAPLIFTPVLSCFLVHYVSCTCSC